MMQIRNDEFPDRLAKAASAIDAEGNDVTAVVNAAGDLIELLLEKPTRRVDTETIDRLFLELSQFTTARTQRERDLMRSLRELLGAMRDYEIDAHDEPPEHHRKMMRRAESLLPPNAEVEARGEATSQGTK